MIRLGYVEGQRVTKKGNMVKHFNPVNLTLSSITGISVLFFVSAMMLSQQVSAAELRLDLKSHLSLDNAVIFATRLDAIDVAVAAMPEAVDIVQEGKQYRPYIQVVTVGDTVRFPNRDDVFHHVYSFSDAKRFEIPLYDGVLEVPEIIFDKPGVVVLGCNIHDWMLAYVLVLNTRFHAEVADDQATIKGLPLGEYELSLWVPSLDNRIYKLESIALTSEIQSQELVIEESFNALAQPSPVLVTEERDDY